MRSFVFVCLLASAIATVFQDCGSIGGNVVFTIEDCEIIPCVVKRGTVYAVRLQFDEVVDTNTLTINATATIGGLEIQWPGIETDACKILESSVNPCPLEDGSAVDWNSGIEVLTSYPAISTIVTIRLVDDNGGAQVCAKIPVVVE